MVAVVRFHKRMPFPFPCAASGFGKEIANELAKAINETATTVRARNMVVSPGI